MNLILPQEIKEVFEKFEENGFQIYLVGGAVRDMLMGKPVIDWDFTTDAKPEQILELFTDSYYNNTFGTVSVPPIDESFKPHEITTFRSEESYSDNRRPDKVTWGNSIDEDLKRRDFTINAIALSHALDIIDPFSGQNDLRSKLIKAVGNPAERFNEDALRLMRAIRLATQLRFNIEENTLNAIESNSALIMSIAKERVRDEFLKILSSSNAHEGIVLLRQVGILNHILPEIEQAFGTDQVSPNRHHIYDVGTHLLMSLKSSTSSDPITNLAILIHDIGKPQTYKKRGETITFYNHEVVGSAIAKKIADRLKLSKAQKDKLYRLVRYHQFTVDETQTDSAIKRFIRNTTPPYIDDMLELRRADRIGSGARETSWRTEEFKKRIIEVQKEPFTVHDLKISGHEVMSQLDIPPGPKIGELLKALFEEVEAKKVKNDKQELVKRLKELAD